MILWSDLRSFKEDDNFTTLRLNAALDAIFLQVKHGFHNCASIEILLPRNLSDTVISASMYEVQCQRLAWLASGKMFPENVRSLRQRSWNSPMEFPDLDVE